jgi:hypothetical protein
MPDRRTKAQLLHDLEQLAKRTNLISENNKARGQIIEELHGVIRGLEAQRDEARHEASLLQNRMDNLADGNSALVKKSRRGYAALARIVAEAGDALKEAYERG